MCGSNHNRFGELFVGRDLACDVQNLKLSRLNKVLLGLRHFELRLVNKYNLMLNWCAAARLNK